MDSVLFIWLCLKLHKTFVTCVRFDSSYPTECSFRHLFWFTSNWVMVLGFWSEFVGKVVLDFAVYLCHYLCEYMFFASCVLKASFYFPDLTLYWLLSCEGYLVARAGIYVWWVGRICIRRPYLFLPCGSCRVKTTRIWMAAVSKQHLKLYDQVFHVHKMYRSFRIISLMVLLGQHANSDID